MARTAVFTATVFLSAALMFILQPMFGKIVTPMLGGSPSVWNTAMVFYQAVLLVGYGYAFLLSRLPSAKAQVGIHAAVILGAALLAHPAASEALGAPPSAGTIPWLLGLFALSVGLPCFALATTAPLIQSWYARAGAFRTEDPYFLYAASNLGSFGALAAYPFLIEPALPVSVQTNAWQIGFFLFAAAVATCGLLFVRHDRGKLQVQSAPTSANDQLSSHEGRWLQRLHWIALSAVPSGLLIAVTSHISADVASAPFMWVVPLALYLVTFVIVFGVSGQGLLKLLPYPAAILAVVMGAAAGEGGLSLSLNLGIHLVGFFVITLALHATLADRRPEPSRLTEFYLMMSLGGVVGGALTALAAPVLFNRVLEYPILLVLAVMLMMPRPVFGLPVAVGGALAAAALMFAGVVANTQHLAMFDPDQSHYFEIKGGLVIAGALVMCLLAAGRPLLLAMAAGTALYALEQATPSNPILIQERSFFGVMKVQRDEAAGKTELVHGTTVHGVQLTAEDAASIPQSYYGPDTPMGQVVATMRAEAKGPIRLGVVGLGAGSFACWKRPEDSLTFFEIDPAMIKIAKDPAAFTYVSNCAPDVPIFVGDARLTIANVPDGTFDVLILDAFSSDMVPAHLMTREAFQLWRAKLSPRGVLVYHVSNRMMALEGVVGDMLSSERAPALAQSFWPNEDQDRLNFASTVVIATRDEAALTPFVTDPQGRWEAPETIGQAPWSDDYTNVIGAIRARLIDGKN
jgi:spermidine synthase